MTPQTAREAQALRIPLLHRGRDIKMSRDAHVALGAGKLERAQLGCAALAVGAYLEHCRRSVLELEKSREQAAQA